MDYPPQLRGLPFLGSALSFFRDPLSVIAEGQAAFGPVFSMRLGPKRVAVIAGPDEGKAVLSLPETTLAARPVYQRIITPMFGEVMQAAEHGVFLSQREALLPALRGQQVAGYVKTMADETSRWLTSLEEQGTFDAVHAMEDLSLSIATRLFLGPELQQRTWSVFRDIFIDVAAGVGLLPVNFPTPKVIRRNRAREQLFALLRPELQAVRADPDPDRFGFFAHLVKPGLFSEDTLIGIVLLTVYAAYETTAAQLAWVLLLLMQNPSWLDRVVTEADATLPGDPAELSYSNLRRLDCLRRCILEAQRLWPVTCVVGRETVQSYEVGPYTVPAGWMTLVSPWQAHRSAGLYPDPEAFLPDRYLPEQDPAGRAAAALLNLGAGVHACLGGAFAEAEMTTVTGLLLRRFTVELPPGSVPAPARGLGMLRPAGHCPVGYRLRADAPRLTRS